MISYICRILQTQDTSIMASYIDSFFTYKQAEKLVEIADGIATLDDLGRLMKMIYSLMDLIEYEMPELDRTMTELHNDLQDMIPFGLRMKENLAQLVQLHGMYIGIRECQKIERDIFGEEYLHIDIENIRTRMLKLIESTNDYKHRDIIDRIKMDC